MIHSDQVLSDGKGNMTIIFHFFRKLTPTNAYNMPRYKWVLRSRTKPKKKKRRWRPRVRSHWGLAKWTVGPVEKSTNLVYHESTILVYHEHYIDFFYNMSTILIINYISKIKSKNKRRLHFHLTSKASWCGLPTLPDVKAGCGLGVYQTTAHPIGHSQPSYIRWLKQYFLATHMIA